MVAAICPIRLWESKLILFCFIHLFDAIIYLNSIQKRILEKERYGTHMDYEMLYMELKKKVNEYLRVIQNIGFAEIEYTTLNHDPCTPEELLETVSSIIDTSKELNQIIEQSPSSIFVADINAKTLRINKTFEELTEIDRKMLLHRDALDIEKDNIFDPSVCILALKEGRRVIAHQSVNGVKDFISAGVPVLNERGEIFRVITNALLDESLSNISTYLKCKKMDLSSKIPAKLIAESREMKHVIQLADLIKNTESTILIEGETGTGKSMLARYIHNTSDRSSAGMREINCGAIPAALLESELFGYSGGAFTGADKRGKPGLIEVCEGGSILLDEISELPLLLQVKLLHFLQEKKLTRVGGTKEISVNVRIIAATNKSLKGLVEKGEFREDLYYRLNVIPITIPPLRERKEDIVPAAEYFSAKYSKLYNKDYTIGKDDARFFLNNKWAGNLRELENYVERLVVTEGCLHVIDEKPLPDKLSQKIDMDNKNTKGDQEHPGQTIKEMERAMIIEAWNKHHSSRKVAESLGISQSTANRKIQKYITNKSK